MKSPHILLIMTDQQTWRAMSAAGNPDLHTPNMDRLVREGTSFRHAYCASPVCGPSRMSLLTGLTPHEHRYTHSFPEQWDWTERGLTSFGHRLQEAGYSTNWIGIWHATEYVPQTTDSTPGFTYLPVTPLPEKYYLGWNMDSLWADRAINFLQTPPEGPFFLGVSIHNPHDICYWVLNEQADEITRAIQTGGASLPPLPENFEIDPDEPELVRHRRTVKGYGEEVLSTRDWSEEDWQKYLYVYYRLVEKADQQIGRILDELDAVGLTEDTLIIFTSDHGEASAAHHLVAKLLPYDEALHTPLVFRYPGKIPVGKVVETQLASGLDLAPTILDYAGAKSLAGARGLSLREVIAGDQAQLRDFVVSELYSDINAPEREARILRTADYKYLFATTGDTAEEALYDLRRDPGETRNLAPGEESQSVLSEMRVRLSDWMRETNDPLLNLLLLVFDDD